jgi:alkylation response protein AidB-like acyl-CoA dehydrogenase
MTAVTKTPEALVEDRLETLVREVAAGGLTEQQVLGRQFELGLAWVHLPEGSGGLGVDAALQDRVSARLAQAGVPDALMRNVIGVGMAGPTIGHYGTDEQRARWLRPLFTAEEIWCQLFSEPGAGSDLAGLATRAVRDGEEWVVNGQKVWTSFAHKARWGILVTRTDPQAVKHRGLTYFVLDMQAPGVDVRPLRQMTGDADFNEVYLTDVRIPDSFRLGEIGGGWGVALTTLMNERTSLGGAALSMDGDSLVGAALRVWRDRDLQDPVLRAHLMDLWLEADAHRALLERGAKRAEAGIPGPESSVAKLVAAELNQRVGEWVMEAIGLDALEYPGYDDRPSVRTASDADPRYGFLRARANTIEGGTTEVMLNILGERVLGLPADPRVDKDVPWADVPRS